MECSNVGSSGLVDYTSQFITNEVFKSKEELLSWVRDVGRKNGFVIVIKTSDYGGGRLYEEETSLLVDMSKSMVRPKEILVTLKQNDALNVTTMKTIYNAHHRNNVIEKAGRSQMQQLLGELEKHNYIKRHRCDNNTITVTDLFWAHPVSLDLFCSFPKVLVMDYTYKTNRYRLPLLEIVGVTSTDMSFSIAFAYL
ncbi:uncharacterized protein LOC114299930 [Camellia sinensis]|uniref:uncharacterized protein LOC114299930 n=1 Tax=Camellia sinensis TaxID=4442 RepID=UPI0010365BB8|nr:uncharacterized protein LOC114299930 [Camellia sinensis]